MLSIGNVFSPVYILSKEMDGSGDHRAFYTRFVLKLILLAKHFHRIDSKESATVVCEGKRDFCSISILLPRL